MFLDFGNWVFWRLKVAYFWNFGKLRIHPHNYTKGVC